MYTIEPVTTANTVSEAFSRMRDLDVSVVPVLENDEVIGVATITDCWGLLPDKYEDQKGFILEDAKRIVLEVLDEIESPAHIDWTEVAPDIKRRLKRFFFKVIERNPLILPIIIPV